MTLLASQPNYFDSTEAGAPSLNNVAGSLLEIIRACGINGFNPKTVTSIVVASGVATATAASHNYTDTYGKLLLIEGATAPLLNGRKQPLSVTTDTFTYAAPGVADGTYTGTMSAKRAPLGLVELHTGTDKAIFGRSAPEAKSAIFRVDDSNIAPASSSIARLLLLESATDVDTFTGLCPTTVQFADGAAWQKGTNNATAKTWAMVGTSRGFYLATQLGTSDKFVLYFLGDGIDYYAGDAYFTLITGQSAATYSLTASIGLDGLSVYETAPSGNTSIFAARGQVIGSPGSEVCDIAGPGVSRPAGSTLQAITFEHVPVCDTVHVIGSSKQVRGEFPGLAVPLAADPFTSLQVVTTLAGSAYLAIPCNSGNVPGTWLIRLNTWGH